MHGNNKPLVTVNSVQEVQKEALSTGFLIDIACLVGNLLYFIVKLIYYNLECLYFTINPPPPKSVKGEIVLITGTGHGIGKELALLYAAEGATVVGWDINAKNNDETIKEIKEMGYKARGYVCDISKRENILEVADKVKKEVGDVTILINNAGIMPTHPLQQHTPAEIEKIFQINILAHFWTLEAFLPSMLKKNYGHIVSLSSMAGVLGTVNLVPYCASKFAVRGMMEALHEELRHKNPMNQIRLTNICPYMVDTGLCKRPRIKYEHIMPLQSPKDVAQTILHAQKNNLLEISIPGYMLPVSRIGRLMPMKAAMDLIDSFDAFIDSDL